MQVAVVADPITTISGKPNFKAKFSFFTSLSTAEAHGFEVKFIGLYGTVSFNAIRDFSL